jgi:L-amino acid N-acyltransferase YncA
MDVAIRTVEQADFPDVSAIFNYYIAESFAAYIEQAVADDFFRERRSAHPDYPFLVAEIAGNVIGFAFLAPFHPAPTMKHSATLTYFIHPDHTGRGIGSRFLDILVEQGQRLGITNYLAHISSRNPGSIKFHLSHGFVECGRMAQVGIKKGQPFDMVWVQKRL